MRFQAPQLGALGVTFTALRLMQFVSVVVIVGLIANFIDEITASHLGVPDVMVGTITVASIAVLYVMISYILYYDSLLPLLIAVGSDFAMLIAFIVVAATSGKSLNTFECLTRPLPPSESSSEAVTFTVSVPPGGSSSSSNDVNTNSVNSNGANSYTSSGYNFIRAVAASKKPTVDYLSFVAQDQPHCYEIKTVWGLSIALCVLFAFSSIVCAGLWRRVKGPGSAAETNKDIEG